MRTSSIAIVLGALMLTAPVTMAVTPWSYAGSFEPDNDLDSQTWMWTSPPLAAKNRIYFNGYTVIAAGLVGMGVNPNVAAAQTAMQPNGIESYNAILGNWVDCNGDGYIGFGEAGLREYDAALLTDTSICPAGTGDVDQWDGVSHNYNGWVTELIPVGTNGGQPSAAAGNTPDFEDDEFDTRIIRDGNAAVWGDYGKPDAGGGFGTCPIRPFPRGTLQTTGGLLDYTDCHSGRAGLPGQAAGLLETWNFLMDSAGDPAGLRFADANDGKSGTLGQIDTLGDEDSSEAAVVLTDCTADPLVDSSATFNETNAQLGLVGEEDQAFIDESTRTKLYPFAPSTVDTSSPTVPGQYNQTSEEFFDDCDTSNDEGRDLYGIAEDDFEGDVATDKRQARFNMEFEDNGILNQSTRGSLINEGLFGLGDVPFPTHEGRAGGSLNNERITHDWFARVALVKSAVPTTRQALGPNADPTAPAEYITYYAYVSSATTTSYVLPGGGQTAKYGADQCGANTSGIHNQWNCDASLWNLNNDGTAMPSVQGGMAVPGKLYNLRDVDCEDGRNNLGVPLGFGALGVAPCVPYS